MGFNLLFYGFGSKKALLERFADTLTNGGVIVANGFLRKMNAKKIVVAAAKAVLRIPVGELRYAGLNGPRGLLPGGLQKNFTRIEW